MCVCVCVCARVCVRACMRACVCVHACSDMEFKQRQPEVEQSQVTMSLKIGSGYHGEVRCVPLPHPRIN